MSSFKCSDNHFIKLRDYTYSLIMYDRYTLLEFNMDYDMNEEDIKGFVNHEIYKLFELNYASVNYQYNDKEDKRGYEIYKENIEKVPFERYNLLSLYDLTGLYNAYNCLDYQIELSHDTRFMDIIKKHIANNIVEKLTDEYFDYVNRWEYE